MLDNFYCFFFFFFKQKTAYEMRISDWSSDVCSSDLGRQIYRRGHHQVAGCDPALPDRLGDDVVTGAMGKARQELGCLRQDPVGHRPVEADRIRAARSEERRVGKEGGSTGRSRWSPYH